MLYLTIAETLHCHLEPVQKLSKNGPCNLYHASMLIAQIMKTCCWVLKISKKPSDKKDLCNCSKILFVVSSFTMSYNSHLKLMSAFFFFLKKDFFSPNESPSKTMKNVFWKSPFRSWDNQIFVIFPLPFKRTHGSGIIYDAMNWIA